MRLLIGLCRGLVVLFWLATSMYAYLVSVPFVFEQFLAPGLVPALLQFARLNGWLALTMAPLTVVLLRLEPNNRRHAAGSALLVGVQLLGALALVITRPLLTLEPGPAALVVSAAALVPVLWLAARDLFEVPWGTMTRSGDPTGHDATAAFISALVVALLYGTIRIAGGGPDWSGGLQSLAAHGLLFATAYCAIAAVRAFADLTSRPAQWETLGGLLLLSLSTAAALGLIVLPALSVSGLAAATVVLLFGCAMGLTIGARGLRQDGASPRDGVTKVLGGIMPRWARASGWPHRLAWTLVVVAVVLAVRAASHSMDWNFVVAKLGAVVVWLLVLATVFQWVPVRPGMPSALPYAVSLLALVGYLGLAGRLPVSPVTLEASTQAADAWVIGDPSFRTVRDWLQPPTADLTAGGSGAGGGTGFFDYLQANTNIGRSVPVAPVPVTLATLDAAGEGKPPHVFLFVIDSLRRDYLSPYNDTVTFTPAIARFAHESTVFTRTFTRYGATGLSVPSIWVGGMVLHKQYVLPFEPMNSLHALLGHHQYREWMSVDNIVNALMPQDPAREELERRHGVADFRLCDALDDVRARLDQVTPDGPPTFVWSLPQDIHVSVLNREGNTAVDDAPYTGFYAPYASRIRRFDACFGAFIDDLKARGLYDESIIVLTSDHGDSLGEEGRWGHAYTIFPEVLQVPLIMHVPESRRAALTTDPAALTFTTDITPTLFALLGHELSNPSPIFGHPLFWPTGHAPPARSPYGLVASSYGSVYGWIDPAGGQLYIADGVNLRDYAYNLDGSATGVARPVTAAVRSSGQRAIRDGIADIASFYRFVSPD